MESGLVEEIASVIQTVGFPAFVAGWFMFRLEKRLDEQTKVLNEIAVALKGLALSHGREE